MDFRVGEDEQALREGFGALLAGLPARDVVAESIRDVAKGGWLGLALPEDGVTGTSFRLVYLCEELGRRLFPAPVSLLAAVVVPFLSEIGDERAGAVAAGETIATIVLPDAGSPFASRWTRVAAVDESSKGMRLRGVARGVLAAEDADVILLPVERQDGTLAVAVLASGDAALSLAADDTLDLTRRSRALDVDGWLDKSCFAGDWSQDHRPLLERCLAAYCLALDAESVGAATEVLARTVEYTRDRRQFGVPVGSFQAVKHQLADCFGAIELERSLIYHMAGELDAHPESMGADLAYSRLAAARLYRHVVERSIQCHGGVGFTWELGLHVPYRQALMYANQPYPLADVRAAVWRLRRPSDS